MSFPPAPTAPDIAKLAGTSLGATSLGAGPATDPWIVEVPGQDPAVIKRRESLFTLGNGFLGVRGCADGDEPGARSDAPVAHLNGVYEVFPIPYHEKAPGFAEASDTRVAVPDATPLRLMVDGVPVTTHGPGTVEADRHWLDLATGAVTRVWRWRSPGGRAVEITSHRVMAPHADGPLVLTHIITALDAPVALSLLSRLVPHQMTEEAGAVHDPRVGPQIKEPPLVWRQGLGGASTHTGAGAGIDGGVWRTRRSRQGVAVAVEHVLTPPETTTRGTTAWTCTVDETATTAGPLVERRYTGTLAAGASLTLTKRVVYVADRPNDAAPDNAGPDNAGPDNAAPDEAGPDDPTAADTALAGRALALLAAAPDAAGVAAAARAALNTFWRAATVEIDGEADSARAVRFNLFQLWQAAGRDGRTSIGAKGQSGEGYEGHFFWDAEIFALPALVFTAPDIARALLVFRHATLDGARTHARRMGHRQGALYPWRTIGGAECSSYFPAGSAQYHINADIAYAVRQYVEASGDEAFLLTHGAEILIETARLWLDVGHFNPRKGGRFVIPEVTGPDEYTAMVDNNLYTNAMAQAHLAYAAEVAERLAADGDPARNRAWTGLATRLRLDAGEPAAWRRAADAMYLPYDEASGLHPQDDSFLDKQPWDIAGTPADHRPLLMHYHPLALYRRQVCKQADAVLAFFLLPGRFEAPAMRRSFAFYETVTVHDSTLSAGVFAIMAAALGQMDKARAYFRETAEVDLLDLHANTGHGLHMAAMAASWMALAHGFAGMRTLGGSLRFLPRCPAGWNGYRLRLRWRGNLLELAVTATSARYQLLDGPGLSFRQAGLAVTLTPAAPAATLPLPAPPTNPDDADVPL